MMEVSPTQMKIVLLGDSGVGKSSIMLRYVIDDFIPDATGTIGANYMSKQISVNDSQITLNIWDTAGQDRFHSLAKMYYRDADVAILVYDITQYQSFTNMIKWYEELKEHSNSKIILAIVGNKEDLIESEEVSIEEATNFADSVSAIFRKTSAKNKIGIDKLFSDIVDKLYPKIEIYERKASIVLSTSTIRPKKKKCC